MNIHYITRGGQVIPVAVERKRVRNLNLRVRKDGSVHLSVPWRVGAEEAQAFLDSKAGWIGRKRAQVLERAQAHSADGEHGEKRIEAGDGSPEAGLPDAFPLWGQARRANEFGDCGAASLDDLYRKELARVLPEVFAWAEPQVGAHASHWTLRATSSRWGSCTPKTGRIRISTRLAAWPRECLEYVVVHELTHLLEPSHNERFHHLVARVVPDERAVRARLRQPPIEPRR